MSQIFRVSDISFSYPGQENKALDGVSLSVEQGDFLVLCGLSGSGKSTLLRLLKPALAPHGSLQGELLFGGRPLEELSRREQSEKIGFVLQSPENQLVTDKVWHELSFGLESLGFSTPVIRRRVAEMASFFGIQNWFYKDVSQLSGGQKQLLNLASVMVMEPSVLILDEPTGQLDPIAASDFLAALGRINRELGTTVILSEHRLEEALPLANTAAVLENGRLLCAGSPDQVGEQLLRQDHSMFLAMPAAMRIWASVESGPPCPITVREGRDWLQGYEAEYPLAPLEEPQEAPAGEETVLEGKELWFRYDQNASDAVKGLSLSLKQGEFLALLGGNGTGKSTALKLLAGLLAPQRGEAVGHRKTALLPQNPQTLFVKGTLREDLWETLEGKDDPEGRLAEAVALCKLEDLLDRHPYDLSGGEQQRAALCKVLLLEPEVLLLDEPTKGLDAGFKLEFAGILQALLKRGASVLMASHDMDFCACYAHRCALFFDGNIVAQGTPREFFSGGSFYTTAANRIARELLPRAVTTEDVIAACGGRMPPPPAPPEVPPRKREPERRPPEKKRKKLPWWRKLLAALSGVGALVLLLNFLGAFDLAALLGLSNRDKMWLYGAFGVLSVLCSLAVQGSAPAEKRQPLKREKLPARTALAAGLILLLIPLTLFLGMRFLGDRKYYIISLLILAECMLPFFLVFEGRKPQARELVLIAVLCALGVASRAALFMLPQFKPVVAITIVAGVAFGGETGFLVGAVTMLVSNMIYSQGPWTPWQMFAMGLIGFLAGLLFRRRRTGRFSLSLFGALACLVVYGGLMNLSSALTWSGQMTVGILLSYYATGFPMDFILAVATFLFLWFGGEILLEKLERVRKKYGL